MVVDEGLESCNRVGNCIRLLNQASDLSLKPLLNIHTTTTCWNGRARASEHRCTELHPLRYYSCRGHKKIEAEWIVEHLDTKRDPHPCALYR